MGRCFTISSPPDGLRGSAKLSRNVLLNGKACRRGLTQTPAQGSAAVAVLPGILLGRLLVALGRLLVALAGLFGRAAAAAAAAATAGAARTVDLAQLVDVEITHWRHSPIRCTTASRRSPANIKGSPLTNALNFRPCPNLRFADF